MSSGAAPCPASTLLLPGVHVKRHVAWVSSIGCYRAHPLPVPWWSERQILGVSSTSGASVDEAAGISSCTFAFITTVASPCRPTYEDCKDRSVPCGLSATKDWSKLLLNRAERGILGWARLWNAVYGCSGVLLQSAAFWWPGTQSVRFHRWRAC